MTQDLLSGQLPMELLVKLRDKLAPSLRLRVSISDGVIPYDKNDLVAIAVGRGTFERGEIAALLRMLPAVRAFVDVGANLGLYSLLAARRMPSESPVLAFEASGVEYDKLCWTIAKNNLSSVHAVHVAVSDEVGEATIHESLSGMGALNRLDRAGKPNGVWRESKVPMITLDSYDVNHGPIRADLIKIDVEGHEAPVIEGARIMLARERPIIMIEMNPSRSSKRSEPARVWALLTELGYRWYGLEDEYGKVSPCSEFGQAINLFAVHAEPRDPQAAAALLSSVAA